MAIPDFNADGDLPEGVYSATLADVLARFGGGSRKRQEVTARLLRIVNLATATNDVDRLILYGSYITTKVEPNDVDLVLLMRESSQPETYPPDIQALFNHMRAHDELGASIFWARPSMIFGMTVDEFVHSWQMKRKRGRRGIVEVKL
jgi:hypothetical protein